MDEIDFFRGIEGESQNGQDLVTGAEHLVRLKKQVGMTRPVDNSLELEKEAGELAESLATPTTCKNCGKVKTACLCKLAAFRDAIKGARASVGSQADDLKYVASGIRNYKTKADQHRQIGAMAGKVAPALAVGGAGYLAGHSSNEKNAEDLHHHLSTKLAELREKTAGSVMERLKDVNPGLVTMTGLGALAGGLGTYLSSRPQKDSGKSKSEEDLEGQVAAHGSRPERGLLSKMHHRNTELEHGYAKAFREHPVGAAAIGTATGAFGGYGLGRLAGAALKMSGGK